MKHLPLILILTLSLSPIEAALADGGHHHQSADHQTSAALSNEVKTNVSITGNTLTITYGPLDLPTGHDGELAASIPKHIFQLPQDRFLVGYKSAVFTKGGVPLPRQYLHHILLINLDKEGVSCPGEPLFFAGAGLEMNETKFPAGYGVKLGKDQKLMTIVAFYHGVPPTKDVMATFTMELAPEETPMQELDVYQVGVNVVCYSKFDNRRQDESDEGIEIQPGVQVDKAPLKFRMDGCVKFAYPHAHDQALLIALENKTEKRTLLRTVPEVDPDGTFRSFQPHQVYQNQQGFEVNTRDDYELVMVHHRPLQAPLLNHGMGNYLLYMT
ncbi:MAG: hypothetical protein HY205_06015, partial [Nitrospirae bacterium]|nr:hypothetical protein [Nitrospirota bacterium]